MNYKIYIDIWDDLNCGYISIDAEECDEYIEKTQKFFKEIDLENDEIEVAINCEDLTDLRLFVDLTTDEWSTQGLWLAKTTCHEPHQKIPNFVNMTDEEWFQTSTIWNNEISMEVLKAAQEFYYSHKPGEYINNLNGLNTMKWLDEEPIFE